MADMPSYFENYINRKKPNRAQRRVKQQERDRRARRATRQWQREQDGKTAETKGDDD